MRFAAPADVSSINLSIGPVAVLDGFVEVPDDLGAGDVGGMIMNGFTLAPAASTPAKLAKADSSAAPASDNPTT